MAASIQDSVSITAQCMCKVNTFTAQVPRSELPLTAFVCHCDSCRHVTGALYSVDVRWPTPRAEVDVSKLKVFHHFPSIDLLFCQTCSSPMFFADRIDQSRKLGVFTGVLKNEPVDLIKFGNHIFVQDTIDGGATGWMQHNPDGSEIKRFKFDDQRNKPEEVPADWPEEYQLTGYESKKEDVVPFYCKCKGVHFRLHRGNYSGVKDSDLPFHIDPKTHKLLASLCACDSCRLQSGIDVFTWTFAEFKNISYAHSDKPFPKSPSDLKKLVDAKEPALGTLTYYSSSPGIERYFCSECSACVFYTTDIRPEVDVAVGLLQASDGARAEGLLSWSLGGKIDDSDDGNGGWRARVYDQSGKDGERYRVSRGYPKNWYRLKRDEENAKTANLKV